LTVGFGGSFGSGLAAALLAALFLPDLSLGFGVPLLPAAALLVVGAVEELLAAGLLLDGRAVGLLLFGAPPLLEALLLGALLLEALPAALLLLLAAVDFVEVALPLVAGAGPGCALAAGALGCAATRTGASTTKQRPRSQGTAAVKRTGDMGDDLQIMRQSGVSETDSSAC
jgi:hypothetical protein